MKKEDRGKFIVDAALKVFSSKGYANTRMGDIAKEAGMSYGLVYHYFHNKEELFNVIVKEWWLSYYSEVERLRDSSLPVTEKITGIIQYLLNICTAHPEKIFLFTTEVSRGFAYHSDVSSREDFVKLFSLVGEIIVEGQQKKIFRSDIKPRYLVYALMGGIDAVLSIIAFGEEEISEISKKRMIDNIASLFFQGALANKAEAS
jgi:TetR/AcrR family fatty acid metabolism transcriptional regulator